MTTLDEDLRRAAAADPGKEALVAGERRMTYAELDAAASDLAARLHALGVERGDRVAILLPNGAEAAIAIYGTLRAGAAFVPLNPTIKADKLAYVLRDCEATAVVTDDTLAPLAQEAREQAPSVRHTFRAEEAAGARGTRSCPAASVSWPGGARSRPAPTTAPISVDLAAIVYTSGSTGRPKGVTLTHANMVFAAGSIVEYLGMRAHDRVLCVIPLSFDYGLYQLLMCVRTGATLILERGFAFPGRVLELLAREEITGLPGVPTIFQVLTAAGAGAVAHDLPELRFLTNTAAALAPATIDALRAAFPQARLYSMYGLTECKRVSWLPPDQLDARPDSVGIPIPGTEVWIEDDERRRLPPGEVGELMVRGAHVMQGYWKDPAATAERLRPGRWPWERVLATGDLFRRDNEGFLYFVGRRDDILKSRGEKVAPREVEAVLHQAEGVHMAAVVGTPDRLLGQAVVAYVVLHEGAELTSAQLRRHCANHLEDYMVPARIELRDELPTTPNGKVDRSRLTEEAAQATAVTRN
ncbi:MAG TPA: class I adenylate-forming enzyme family protein [Conexibacter sp.]|nr:class I adenylate-forming enzyme family protein [Conexibacter sp.]